MATTHFSRNKSGGVVSTNLDGVTSATNGASLGVRDFSKTTIFVNVSVNTGAVTVKTEVSPDGSAWFERFAKTYTASVEKDIFILDGHAPFVRTTTTTQSNATVTTYIAGGN